MKTYVLVHGAFNTGELWDQIKKLLENDNSKVYCPTLDNPKNSTLTKDIETVCTFIEKENLSNIILVGFSYGGMVVTGVFDRLYKKIARLVYVDTAICQTNKALFDYLDPRKYGLEDLPPFLEKLNFNEDRFDKISKSFIFCTKSEFKEMSENSYNFVKVHFKEKNWDYYTIDSKHKCMLYKPDELAKILKQISLK